jgi:hypothetical protein
MVIQGFGLHFLLPQDIPVSVQLAVLILLEPVSFFL